MLPSETTSVKVSLLWDWAHKKVGEQEAVMLSPKLLDSVLGSEDAYPRDVIVSRLRMRGTGRVLVVRCESSPGKDMRILGHSIEGISRDVLEGNK